MGEAVTYPSFFLEIKNPIENPRGYGEFEVEGKKERQWQFGKLLWLEDSRASWPMESIKDLKFWITKQDYVWLGLHGLQEKN